MKRPVVLAALLTAMAVATMSLPAFAASVNTSAPNGIPEASVKTQYAPVAPRHRNDRFYVDRHWDGYGAYAASPASRHTFRNGQPCVSGLDRGAASAFPSWELCSGR
jgi:hypothetical protein